MQQAQARARWGIKQIIEIAKVRTKRVIFDI
jgi:hypothetical protein